jgi:hypothetical protein
MFVSGKPIQPSLMTAYKALQAYLCRATETKKNGFYNTDTRPETGIWPENFVSALKPEATFLPGRSWSSGSRPTGRRRDKASSRWLTAVIPSFFSTRIETWVLDRQSILIKREVQALQFVDEVENVS